MYKLWILLFDVVSVTLMYRPGLVSPQPFDSHEFKLVKRLKCRLGYFWRFGLVVNFYSIMILKRWGYPGEACLSQLTVVPDVFNIPALLIPYETLIPTSSPTAVSLL